MPDTREKLIELLWRYDQMRMMRMSIEECADHLIANGLTFATDNNVGGKWIPVTERLPEDGETVLVYGSKGGIYTAYCNRRYQNVGWHKLNSKSHYCNPTHWMPLPTPPEV